VSLTTLREYIDWTPFFHTWELKGVYPRILDHELYGAQARLLFIEANALLDQLCEKKQIGARGVYGFFPANAVGDDVELYADPARKQVLTTFHFLRQQAAKDGVYRCLADFVAPKTTGLRDHLGAFAVTSGLGLKELADSHKAKNDDYTAIMVTALADRLAEAFAEYLHQRVRQEWGYGTSEDLTAEDLIHEKYRGIRPAAGYPACPDHTEKAELWRLLDVDKNAHMQLTESFAMWPAASVSGLYFAHPESRYFAVGKLDRDQIADYKVRKQQSTEETERWLRPNLGYEPAS
jgi:5-methyltetrahydrofolate--homocysteine methyltransferase